MGTIIYNQWKIYITKARLHNKFISQKINFTYSVYSHQMYI